jgi:hypothetical protein
MAWLGTRGVEPQFITSIQPKRLEFALALQTLLYSGIYLGTYIFEFVSSPFGRASLTLPHPFFIYLIGGCGLCLFIWKRCY